MQPKIDRINHIYPLIPQMHMTLQYLLSRSVSISIIIVLLMRLGESTIIYQSDHIQHMPSICGHPYPKVKIQVYQSDQVQHMCSICRHLHEVEIQVNQNEDEIYNLLSLLRQRLRMRDWKLKSVT
jgi:hypothetical protein